MMIVPFIVMFFVFFNMSPYIIEYMIDYLSLYNVVSLSPTESIITQFNLSFSLAILFSIPIFIYLIYKFIRSELSVMQRRKIIKTVFLSCTLSFIGIILSIILFSRYLFKYFISHSIVSIMWSINSIISFIIISAVSFSIMMQIIIIIPSLTRLNILNIERLKKMRLSILIISMIISALITPPDIISLWLMVIPLYSSYEIGLFLSKHEKVIKNDRNMGNSVDNGNNRFNSIIRQENNVKDV